MEKVLICCLLSVCSTSLVQGAPQQYIVFQELIQTLDGFGNMVKTDAEELHSPTNTPENCLFSAFECFVNETSYLKPKNQNEDNFNVALRRIKSFLHKRNFQVPDKLCSPCTSYEKKPVQDFIQDFITLLRKMNMSAMGNRLI